MQTSHKSPRPCLPEPQAGLSWSPWLDLALSIGRAILGCERLFADVALTPPIAAGAKPQPSLVLIHSSASAAAGARRPASSLRLVYTAPPRRRHARTA